MSGAERLEFPCAFAPFPFLGNGDELCSEVVGCVVVRT